LIRELAPAKLSGWHDHTELTKQARQVRTLEESE
jgi:hypothetical protein